MDRNKACHCVNRGILLTKRRWYGVNLNAFNATTGQLNLYPYLHRTPLAWNLTTDYHDLNQGLLQLQARVSTKWSSINSFFFLNDFNISSVFGVQDTLLSHNPSGLHSYTSRPGAVKGLASTPSPLLNDAHLPPHQLDHHNKKSIKIRSHYSKTE